MIEINDLPDLPQYDGQTIDLAQRAFRSAFASATMAGAVYVENEMQRWRTVMRAKLILTGLLILGVGGCSTIPPKADEIPAHIAVAKSPAEHQRIADYFTQKARDYDAEAAWHNQLAKSYVTGPKSDPGAMKSHCRALHEQFVLAAKEARGLAEAHRHMAAKGGN